MQPYKILWADDEIDLLKPHILFLNNKGYDVTPVNSGSDALDEIDHKYFDIIFLDENMPGMTGLETLNYIKSTHPNLPVVMITKNEEEQIMEDAIGSKIADYLIKPLNPNQILLSVKRILDNRRLVSEKTNLSYQQDFKNISMAYNDYMNHEEWVDVYKKLVYWELEIDNTDDKSMAMVLESQKEEANKHFTRFIADNYESWLNDPKSEKPVLSHQLMKAKVFPELTGGVPVFFIVIDNLRYDQWKVIEPIVQESFNLVDEDNYYSILPTTTAYARNSIFSGMTPLEMSQKHPDIWVGEDEDDRKNNYEDEFVRRQLKRNRLDIKSTYNKIIHTNQGKQLVDNFNNLLGQDLNVIVYNFVDMLSHARTDLQMIRELAPDESAYRSITKSWFTHSSLHDLLKKIADNKAKVIITTDHGTIRVKRPFKIVGDKNTNTNLRYKQGKNLNYNQNKVFTVRNTEQIFLPRTNVSTAYVFSVEDYFFAYPNNYNHYVNYYKDTFQHGGVSLEEMILPIVILSPKGS